MIRCLPKSEIRVYDGNGLIMTVNYDDSYDDNFDKNDPVPVNKTCCVVCCRTARAEAHD